MAFDLSNYEPVADRIHRFWEQYPTGRILTEIVERTESDIIVKAEVYTDRDDLRPATIDYAQESIGLSQITRHSWLETCSTSAIGRALATLGFSPKGAPRPSREEMNKVNRHSETDWLAQAQQIQDQGDLLALKDLYRSAKGNGAVQSVLDAIEAMGKALTPTEA